MITTHSTTLLTSSKLLGGIRQHALLDRVEARGNFKASSGCSPGNEKRRWHGTRRECLLGTNGNTTFCSSSACSLCRILETSYSLKMFGRNTQWGRQVLATFPTSLVTICALLCRFGVGIYTSSTSSKSDHYSSNRMQSKTKAILLNKVVVGKGYKATQNEPSFTAPPPGYDSVIADVRPNGPLNYDELVCYTENAIRPSYLVVYDA
ncbi:hypothetical protein ID866_7552 [Astraeus odoratus]|nr:hypothetical protein ID866_7552 [Astraeus odoratus]